MKRKTIIISAISYISLIAVILIIGLTSKKAQPSSDSALAALTRTITLETIFEGETATRTMAADNSLIQTQEISELINPTSGTAYPMPVDQQTGYPVAESTDLSTPITPSRSPSPQFQSSFGTRTPTHTSLPTTASTRTRTATQAPSKTPTRTPTAPTQTGWEGEWTAYWQQPDGNFQTGMLNIQRAGSQLSATGDFGGTNYTFEGEIYFNDRYCAGSWAGASGTGGFFFSLLPDDQLIGNAGYRVGLCGSRNTAAQPDPCYSAPAD